MTISKEELQNKQLELSAQVSKLSSGTLLLHMRYMAKAISRLRQVPYQGSYRCDGRTICYDPAHLLARYQQSERLPVHDYLHMLLHCVFRHWHVGGEIDRMQWNLACDIAAEAMILHVGAKFCGNDKIAEKSAVILELSAKVRPFTAEKLYAYFTVSELSETQIREYSGIFVTDDHAEWYHDPTKEYEDEEQLPAIALPTPERNKPPQSENGGDSDHGSEDSKEQGGDQKPKTKPDDTASHVDAGLEDYLENEYRRQREQLNDMWKELSKEIQSELEHFGTDSDADSRYLVQLLAHLNRERYDYAAFLRRFAVSGEVMHADLDAFEPGFYSYGLSLYGNVALIEPPEYKETYLVRDFVIAIDTSGSVQGKTVQRFMQKTYNILKSTESFFTKVNIFIIQCDTVVQDAVQITSQSEFDRYLAEMELKGLGGTDFRPVFDYVDALRKNGRLNRLKGMVYFTDGYGAFPEKKPMYDTVFAFLEEPPGNVPPWAIKLILAEEDIIDDK